MSHLNPLNHRLLYCTRAPGGLGCGEWTIHKIYFLAGKKLCLKCGKETEIGGSDYREMNEHRPGTAEWDEAQEAMRRG